MTNWNYRVLSQRIDKDEYIFTIHEVHYSETNRPSMYSTNPISPSGSTPKGLKKDIKRLKKALDKPILSMDDFPKEHTT